MYKVLGKDSREYGPATAEQIIAWIKEGRLDAQSKVKAEAAGDWSAIGDLPEFREVLLQRQAPEPSSAAAPAAVARMSGLAIASLVLGILGFFTLGATSLVGLILGIVAILKINKSQGRMSGSGLAIAGTCVSGVTILMLPIMAAMLLPALARAKSRAQTVNCMNNVKQLNLALMMYATDNKGTFPPADTWCDLLRPYAGGSPAMFRCPAAPEEKCSYKLNANLADRKLFTAGAPARTVVVFSAVEGWNQAGGRSAAVPHKHGNQYVIGFADGHVEAVRADRLGGLSW